MHADTLFIFLDMTHNAVLAYGCSSFSIMLCLAPLQSLVWLLHVGVQVL